MEFVIVLSVIFNVTLFMMVATLQQIRNEKQDEIEELNKKIKVLKNENKTLESKIETLENVILLMTEIDNYTTDTSKKLINKLARDLDKNKKSVGYSNDLLLNVNVVPIIEKDFGGYTVKYKQIAEDLINASPKDVFDKKLNDNNSSNSNGSSSLSSSRENKRSNSSSNSDYSISSYSSSYSSYDSSSSSSSCDSSYSSSSSDSGGGFCD